jgi:hypothetical protein
MAGRDKLRPAGRHGTRDPMCPSVDSPRQIVCSVVPSGMAVGAMPLPQRGYSEAGLDAANDRAAEVAQDRLQIAGER